MVTQMVRSVSHVLIQNDVIQALPSWRIFLIFDSPTDDGYSEVVPELKSCGNAERSNLIDAPCRCRTLSVAKFPVWTSSTFNFFWLGVREWRSLRIFFELLLVLRALVSVFHSMRLPADIPLFSAVSVIGSLGSPRFARWEVGSGDLEDAGTVPYDGTSQETPHTTGRIYINWRESVWTQCSHRWNLLRISSDVHHPWSVWCRRPVDVV